MDNIKELDNKINDLVDISTVSIKESLPGRETIKEYLSKIKNPYKYKSNKYIVSIKYSKKGNSLEEKLIENLNILL